jgi:hypothetical protein
MRRASVGAGFGSVLLPGETKPAGWNRKRHLDDSQLLTTDNCSKLLDFSELRVSDVNGLA